ILGRGQRNESWQTEDHKNLTFSLLLNNLSLDPQEYFKLNALVSLALVEFLNEIIPTSQLFVKWPNDILAGQQKICGILIENILQGKTIDHSVVGIGLNVNQTDFIDLPRAGSLKRIAGHDFELDNLLKELVEKLEE